MELRLNTLREKQNRLFADRYENDYCFLQFHSPIEIYMVDRGEMEMLVNGRVRRLSAGQISVALSYDAHAYNTPAESASSIVLIPPHLCEEFMAQIAHKRLADPFITDPAAYARIKACHDALMQEGISHVRQLGYLYIILGTVLEAVVLEDADKPINFDLASKILFYVNENFKDGISPASIAAHFGYNQSYVSRYFKACCGIPLVHYLTAVRLKNAVMLMLENRHDIGYCAFESGFSSMRTFYRSFRQEFGCSPKEYIAQLREI